MTKSRREIEEETRKDHILHAAERLFAQYGLHDTSVADIAKEAEFGVGTLYKYFKDKNTLIQSLLNSRMGDHFDEMDAILGQEGNPVEIINGLIDGYLNSVKERRLFFNIYFTHFHPGALDGYCGFSDALDHSYIFEKKKQMIEQMERIFKKGIDDGVFVNMDSRYLTTALFGMFISFTFMLDGNLSESADTEEVKQAMKRILFDQVMLA